MARVTVEDCMDNVGNRFELVLRAAKRARAIAYGSPSPLPAEKDKPTVHALREIAEGIVVEDLDETPAEEVIDEQAMAEAVDQVPAPAPTDN